MIFCITFFIIFLFFSLLFLYANSTFFFKEKSDFAPKTNFDDCFSEFVKPVELSKKRKQAIIMVHGFPSSPSSYRTSADIFFKQGYDVFVPLLPGFGTSPKNFVETNFTQWYNYLKKYYLEKRAKYDKLYVIGTSMGGSLTLKLAEEFSETEFAPTAIATAAAPVFLNNLRLGVCRQPAIYAVRILSLFTKSVKATINNGKTPERESDGDGMWRGYEGLFPKQTYSLYMNLKLIKKDLKKITVPIFLGHCKKDKTVPFRNMLYIADQIKSKNVKLEIVNMKDGFKHNYHCLFMYDSIREQLVDKVINFYKNEATKWEKFYLFWASLFVILAQL